MRDEPRYLRVKNTTSEEIPPFAAMRMTGVTLGVIDVAKPDTDSETSTILFNGPVKIAAGTEGVGTRTFPLTAAYDTGDGTPAVEGKWGAASGSWKLRSAKKGYMFIGVGADGFGPVVEAGGLYTLDCEASPITVTGPT